MSYIILAPEIHGGVACREVLGAQVGEGLIANTKCNTIQAFITLVMICYSVTHEIISFRNLLNQEVFKAY